MIFDYGGRAASCIKKYYTIPAKYKVICYVGLIQMVKIDHTVALLTVCARQRNPVLVYIDFLLFIDNFLTLLLLLDHVNPRNTFATSGIIGEKTMCIRL